MLPGDQLSILQASAPNGFVIKASLFIDWKGRGETPEPFYSALPSVKAVEKPPLTMSKQFRESRPLLLHPVTSAMLCYLISSAGKVFELVAAEKAAAVKLSYLVRDSFIFHGWPRRCLMELLTAHHTSCPPSAMQGKRCGQLSAGSITPFRWRDSLNYCKHSFFFFLIFH